MFMSLYAYDSTDAKPTRTPVILWEAGQVKGIPVELLALSKDQSLILQKPSQSFLPDWQVRVNVWLGS